jgi:hypothetical protein
LWVLASGLWPRAAGSDECPSPFLRRVHRQSAAFLAGAGASTTQTFCASAGYSPANSHGSPGRSSTMAYIARSVGVALSRSIAIFSRVFGVDGRPIETLHAPRQPSGAGE